MRPLCASARSPCPCRPGRRAAQARRRRLSTGHKLAPRLRAGDEPIRAQPRVPALSWAHGPGVEDRPGQAQTACPAGLDHLQLLQESAVKLQIWHAARRRRARWHKTERKSILPAQRPRSSAQSLESAGPANEGEARFEQGCGIWCGHRCCTLQLYPALYLGARISNYASGLVELGGLEPPTPCLQTEGSTSAAVCMCRSASQGVRSGPPGSWPVAVLSCCTVQPWPARAPPHQAEPDARHSRHAA